MKWKMKKRFLLLKNQKKGENRQKPLVFTKKGKNTEGIIKGINTFYRKN